MRYRDYDSNDTDAIDNGVIKVKCCMDALMFHYYCIIGPSHHVTIALSTFFNGIHNLSVGNASLPVLHTGAWIFLRLEKI